MPRGKKFTKIEIARILPAIVDAIEGGADLRETCQEHGMSPGSFYRWRKLYGDLLGTNGRSTTPTVGRRRGPIDVDPQLTVRDKIREENAQLRRLLVDRDLELAVLREENIKLRGEA